MDDGFGGLSGAATRMYKNPCADVSYSNYEVPFYEGPLSTVVEKRVCAYEDGSTKTRETVRPFEVVEAKRVLREKRDACRKQATNGSRAIFLNFSANIKCAFNQLKVSGNRDTYIRLAFRDTQKALMKLKNRLMSDPVCREVSECSSVPTEWLESVQKLYDEHK